MLKHFNEELTRLWRARSLDPLADLAEALLDAAVAIVEVSPAHVVLATGSRASAEPAAELVEMLAALSRSAAHILPVAEDDRPNDPEAPVAAIETGGPSPFARLVAVPLRFGARTGFLMVFPSVDTVRAGPLRAVSASVEKAFADLVRAEAHRDKLLRFITLLDHLERAARIGVWELELGSGELFWSDEVFRIYGMEAGSAPSVAEALAPYREPGRARLSEAVRLTEMTGRPTDLVLPITTVGGDRRVARVIATLQRDGDGAGRLTGVIQDVTSQEEVTERLWWTANHDALTGIPNRALLADRFRKALQRSPRRGKELALVLVDVDQFKTINDTLGHAAGDELLRIVAAQLKAAVREEDTVARSGGDEFTILLDDLCPDADLDRLLARLREAMSVRFVWEEQTMLVSMSGGAAVAPRHAQSELELTAAADMALYRAKAARGVALVLFQPAFGLALEERSRLLAAVRQALDEGRIVPWYQPQIDVVSGRIVGVEALARWLADDGVKTAADFVSAISDHEIGARIGTAVVDHAIAEIAALNAPRSQKIALSINASAGELVRARFLERIGQEVARSGGGGSITVEIAEEIILDDPDRELARRLEAASAAGVRFSLDEVGTGDTSSLVRVSALPISEVKIARRFVSGLGRDPDRQKVVRGIINVARALDLRVIVEGVETESDVADIVALGGRYLQGFYYSRAVPLQELKRLLEAEDVRLDAAA